MKYHVNVFTSEHDTLFKLYITFITISHNVIFRSNHFMNTNESFHEYEHSRVNSHNLPESTLKRQSYGQVLKALEVLFFHVCDHWPPSCKQGIENTSGNYGLSL